MTKISVKGMYVIAKGITFNRDANGMHYRPALALQKHLSRTSSPILYPDKYRIVFGKKTFLIADIPSMAGSGISHGDTFDIVSQIDPELYYQKMAEGIIEAAKMDLWYLVRWFEMTPTEFPTLTTNTTGVRIFVTESRSIIRQNLFLGRGTFMSSSMSIVYG